MKKQVGDVAIDLSQLDGHWVDFRADVRSVTAADSPLLQESAKRADEGSSGIVLYDPNAPSFDDFATFRQAASDHGASESSAWSDFTKKASKTEKELPGFLDYLASLIPRGFLEGGKRRCA
ncbi:MAG TPA: hypothetical protein RMH85_24520 [Polyangiaceae bacterium LLY-WYZ-15_(1-7)]|nr:hypothetical protein [Myxococcales bacterium]MAT24846.1 hypothetical protein [Sandaracinus sp.]HJK93348.1 hypothetical protein [Polyangiaceae bacterium LLY-WYZ-15_(1-7)]MBJ74200.1 hypothetical protein [Sandaracinus sp.]HJL02373.1 hypothetical protein [Polyangiaceae bacterium LLY-WYZ-15_(1-7)]